MNRADGPEDRSSDERCFLNPLPVAGGVTRIVQSPESVDFYYDIGQGTGFNRVVPIANRPHPAKEIRQYWGDSVGRWEGDTFVVDVTNFTHETNYRGSRENLHLIERYKRVDADTLEITITAEDPTTWVRPFTFVRELKKNPKSRIKSTKAGARKATTRCSECSRIPAQRRSCLLRGKVPTRQKKTTRPAAATIARTILSRRRSLNELDAGKNCDRQKPHGLPRVAGVALGEPPLV